MNSTADTVNQARPTLSPLAAGHALKVFEVTGKAGMVMPLHYSTHEAVVTIKSGSAKLIFQGSDHLLSTGSTFLIEAGKLHSLTVLEDFKAAVVMPVDSEIKFDPSANGE